MLYLVFSAGFILFWGHVDSCEVVKKQKNMKPGDIIKFIIYFLLKLLLQFTWQNLKPWVMQNYLMNYNLVLVILVQEHINIPFLFD